MNKSKLLTLIKYFVSIDFFAILSIKQNLKTKGKKAASFQGIAGILVFLVLFIYGAPKVGEFIARNFQSPLGRASITSISVGVFIFTLFLSLATAFVFIEKNNETEILLSLPISGSDIFLARIYSLAITFYVSFFIMFSIAIGVTGYTVGKGLDFYIFSFIGLMILDLETILITGVIIIFFGKLLKTSKLFNRFLKLIYGIFMVGLFVIYMIFTQAASNPALGINISKFVVDFENKLSSIFFFVIWIKKIILSNDLITSITNLAIGLAICIVLALLLKFLAERNYLSILRSVNVVSKESKSVIEKRKKQGVAQSRQYKWFVLFKKELKEIITTPTFFMQIFLIDLMLVIFGGVGIYYGIQYKSQLVLAINIFVSREGKAFWVLASAPISVDTHLISRIFACQVLHFATATIVILLSMIIYVFNPLVYVAIILGMMLTFFVSGSLNMILGLVNPYFDWKTPKEALNGGSGQINVFVSILINYGLYGILIFLTVKMVKMNQKLVPIVLANLGLIILTGIISYIIDRILFKKLLKRL